MQLTNKQITILFIGDVFGEPGLKKIKETIPKLKKEFPIDFVIAQSENVSGRKGLNQEDYLKMKSCGVDAFTLGNHVWSKNGIFSIINNDDVIRPANIDSKYPGHGSHVFKVKNNMTIRVTSLMGITFNKLNAPWNQEYANNFFDTIDHIIEHQEQADFHFIDFHAETTSEKYVLALYLDGKIDGLCGTHTHVQTSDAHVLPKGTCYITDAGMVGPYNSAIGASFLEVYKKMRYDEHIRFKVSKHASQFNGAILTFNTIKKKDNKIIPIKILP